MIVKPYQNDRLFRDGLSTLDVDGDRFRAAMLSTGSPKGIAILDIGSYPGTAFEFFGKENSYKALGLIHGDYADTLNEANIPYENIDIQSEAGFASDADLILFQEILEHIRMPKKCLHNIYKGMKPGAKLYITTNNFYYYGYIIKLILNRPILDPIDSDDSDYPGHCRYYSVEEVKSFFERNGAEILLARRINFTVPVHCYRNRLLGILKNTLAVLLPNIYATHIELLICKPELASA